MVEFHFQDPKNVKKEKETGNVTLHLENFSIVVSGLDPDCSGVIILALEHCLL